MQMHPHDSGVMTVDTKPTVGLLCTQLMHFWLSVDRHVGEILETETSGKASLIFYSCYVNVNC